MNNVLMDQTNARSKQTMHRKEKDQKKRKQRVASSATTTRKRRSGNHTSLFASGKLPSSLEVLGAEEQEETLALISRIKKTNV